MKAWQAHGVGEPAAVAVREEVEAVPNALTDLAARRTMGRVVVRVAA